jgi:hypothetical protein
MAIKYWEFEDAPLKEKLKSPSIKDIAKIFFDNETEAYRFSLLLLESKRRKGIKLKDVPENIPIATAKRYLDYAVQVGLLKHEDGTYLLTDRYTRPFKNIAAYIKAWMESEAEEDLSVQFAGARREKQFKRGGRSTGVQPTSAEKSSSSEQTA